MPTPDTFQLGDRTVRRMGYGAMQLAGPGVFGPPKDRAQAIAVLREAVARGVNHIDTCDYYGPHVVNEIIREALHPYPDDLTLVTKIGARRGADASWIPAQSPAELTAAVHDNLRNLGLDVLPADGSPYLGPGEERRLRGGCHHNWDLHCRVFWRYGIAPDAHDGCIGFRVVLGSRAGAGTSRNA